MSFPDWRLLERRAPLEALSSAGRTLRAGDRVLLRPKAGGDILDLALAGRIALIDAIEQDYEDRIHVAVVIEDDPGRDFGSLRQPAHRFFFSPEEVEPVPPGGHC